MTDPFLGADDLADQLRSIVSGVVQAKVPLAPLARWRIGGPCLVYVEPSTGAEVADVLAFMRQRPEPVFIMGDATNVLFDSRGFRGVVIRIGQRMSSIDIDGDEVNAGAGIWVPALARRTANAGLSGLEHIVGIPGSLGGLIAMNGGSNRRGIGENVETLTCVDRHGQTMQLARADCEFGYRQSLIQTTNLTVIEARLRLELSTVKAVRDAMLAVLRSRRHRFPKKQPNCGSTFVSSPEMFEAVGPPGRVIEAAGLKGFRRGGAAFSELHANFIINLGDATSDDVLSLIAVASQVVERQTGYRMRSEVKFLDIDGTLLSADLPALERWGGSLPRVYV